MTTVIKQVPPRNSTDSSQTGIGGPLADLEKSGFDYNVYQYPTVMNPEYPDKGHYIAFYINIPKLSSWAPENSTNNPQPIANRNSDATRFGLRPEEDPDSGNSVGRFLENSVQGLANLVLENKTVRTTAAIALYIPPTMIFMQQANYQTISLTQALGLAGDAGYGVSSLANGDWKSAAGAFSSMVPAASRIGQKIAGRTSKIGKALGSLQNAVGSNFREAVLSSMGIADNPQNFLLFKQMEFRKFQFDFLLTPEDPNEASIINEIIYLFRFHSSPEVLSGSSGRFFVPPSMFDIDFIHDGNRNQNIPLISTCVCTSVNIDYGASGQWGTTWDGMPQQIRLTLDFTESEIITKDRVQEGF